MRKPKYDLEVFKRRRTQLAPKLKQSALILFSHPDLIRNNDVHHPYRQDSNLFYLTGFEEPESILVFRPGLTPETILFVREKNLERETWDGFRFGPALAKETFGVDAAYPIDEFSKMAPKLLVEVEAIYYSMYLYREYDERIKSILETLRALRGRSNRGILPVHDARPLIGEMRIRKDPEEKAAMKRACHQTALAHIDVMKAARPGINERALQGVFIRSVMERGASREGYQSIVATGSNSTTLHYVFNDQTCRDGELLLVDAGGEFDYYTGDITRTFPVNGKFSAAQRRIYSSVLELQKDLINQVRPGQTILQLQKRTISGLVDIMVSEKLLSGSKPDLIEKQAYLKYYPHGVGHWLGSDVHDAGLTEINGEPRPLEPGFCLTIEPGIYIPAGDSSAPEELRGIGIRIEDDVLVTDQGCEVLTAAAPKEIKELEEIIGSG